MKHKVVWRGTEDEAVETIAYKRRWEANVPQEVDDKDGYEIEESVRMDNPDGTFKLVPQVRKVTYIEMMRNNPCFDVGEDVKKHQKRKRPDRYPDASREFNSDVPVERMEGFGPIELGNPLE